MIQSSIDFHPNVDLFRFEAPFKADALLNKLKELNQKVPADDKLGDDQIEGQLINFWYTGCLLNIVFYSKILKYIPDSGLSRFPFGVSVCSQWQVKYHHCIRTDRVQKNHYIIRKNTIFNEHPVYVNSNIFAMNKRFYLLLTYSTW